jgi:DNA repair exonuclease SbcCD ATPase subunit
LYQLPPGEFVAARNALAKRAGAAGAEIRALPKPTAPVWAVNQLHWRQPDIYRALIESAENLRATHKAVLAGKKGDLRAAGRTHEEALERALKAALAIVAEGGHAASDPVRQSIGATLRALPASDPPGRLRQALQPSGFAALTGLPAGGRVIPGPPARPAATAARKTGRGEPARKVDKEALARAKRLVEATTRSFATADQAARREEFEAARAAREAEKAQRRVKRAHEAIAEAQSELEDAERELRAAQKKLDTARTRAAAADEALETARSKAEAARRDEEAARGSR